MAWCSTRKYEELVPLYSDLVKHGVDRILTTKCVLVSADLNFGNNIHVYICTHVHTRYVCIHTYFDNPRNAFTFSFRTNSAFLIFVVNEHLLRNLSVMTTSMIKFIICDLYRIVIQWRLKVPIYCCEQFLLSGAHLCGLGHLDEHQKAEKYLIRWSL